MLWFQTIAGDDGGRCPLDNPWAMHEHDALTHQIIGAAITVSRALGVGLLESVYETCLVHELQKRGMEVARQAPLPVTYDGMRMELGFRADMIVEQAVVVEVKAISTVLPVHEAQLLNYMRLSRINKGLLFNFSAFPFASGIKRRVI